MAGGVQPKEGVRKRLDLAIQRRVERALETILDHIAGQKPAAYRDSLFNIAAALRAEADEIEILANESNLT